jgi:hypothetical protein
LHLGQSKRHGTSILTPEHEEGGKNIIPSPGEREEEEEPAEID